MPQAVTHILIPLFLVSFWRDYVLSKNKKAHFPLHYVLIAGLAGGLPDIDILISIILKFAGSSEWWIHKTFTHSLLFPLCFLVLAFAFRNLHAKARLCNLGRHKMKLSIIFLMIAVGTCSHIFLDFLAGEQAYFFYPFSLHDFGLNLFSFIPLEWPTTAALIDGILLVLWLAYLEFKHKISDFI